MARGPYDSLDVLGEDELRAELRRARARLDEQRELLDEAHRHGLANASFTLALGTLSRSTTLERAGLIAALVEVVQAAAECLELERVGVWLADAAFERLECVALVHQGVVSRRPGTILDRASYPEYFAAAAAERVLPVTDVASDPATRELVQGYLGPLGIRSLLDAPVRVFGRVVGIVCHEHTGPQRAWTEAEQAFAAHVGDFVALAIETFRREESRRAEIDAESRYRHMVEGLPVTVYRIEPGRGLTYVSPHIEKLTGRPQAEWRGADGLRAWLDRVNEADRERVRERLRRDGIPFDEGIEYRIRADVDGGGERWVHDVTHELRGADGSLLAIEGVLSDVTERMGAHDAVMAWERRFQSLFSRGDLSLFTIDARGRVNFVSSALLELTGRRAEQVLGRSIDVLFPDPSGEEADGVVQQILGADRRDETSRELTVVLSAPDAVEGTPTERQRTLRFRLTGLPGSLGDAVIGVGLDVSAMIELAQHAHDHDKEASLARLAAGVAHDVANLLGAIQLTAHTLTRSEDPVVRREALDHLTRCATQATELNRRLVDIARSRPTEPRSFPLDAFLEGTLPLLQGLLSPRQMTLDARLDARAAVVHIGETELRQILLNLVTNAIEAAPEGSRVTLRTHLTTIPKTAIGHGPRGRFVALEVEDEGPGIAESLRRRIFEPYFTTKARPTSSVPPPSGVYGPQGGTGLGLATSRGLARQAGGELRAESKTGGARLVLLLPLVDAPAQYGEP